MFSINNYQLNEVELSLGLTHSKGFSKIVRFDYHGKDDDYVLVISPKMPIDKSCLTRQRIYFRNYLECQIRLWLPDPVDSFDDEWFESANNDFHRKADNCLFEYSLCNPDIRLSTRTDNRVAGKQKAGIERCWTVQNSEGTRKLLVDGDKVGIIFSDENKEYSKIIAKFVEKNILNRRTLPSQAEILSKDYYFYDELEILSKMFPFDEPITEMDLVRAAAYKPETKNIDPSFVTDRPPDFEFIHIDQEYDPLLLDFYFAGLSSFSPMMEFKNYYNILEYFFDNQFNEVEQLIHVINQHFQSPEIIKEFLCSLPEEDKKHFSSFNETIGYKRIRPLSFDSKLLLEHVSDRIYQFRNAIFHSKKSYEGKSNRNFVPFSNDEAIIQKENLLLRWIAQEVIKQNQC